MTQAFVLVNTELGAEGEVRKKLVEHEEVIEAHVVYGVYDLIVKLKTDTMDQIKRTVSWKIRRMDKVRSTLTMIVMEE